MDIAAIVVILLRDVSRMGYLAKQVFEVLEVNSEKDIEVSEASSLNLNDSFREPINWNRLTSMYEVNYFFCKKYSIKKKKKTEILDSKPEILQKMLDMEIEL